MTGAIFVPAGLVKFAFHAWELHAFRLIGIPAPATMEIVVGALETAGAVLLLRRVLVVPTAVVLAAIMAVATGAAGIARANLVPSLTLAPALLVAMLFLAWRGLRPSGARR